LSSDLPAGVIEIRKQFITNPSPDGIGSGVRSGEAILAHDAGVVAIIAARQADRDVDNAADGGIVVRDPYSQVGFIEEMRCTNRSRCQRADPVQPGPRELRQPDRQAGAGHQDQRRRHDDHPVGRARRRPTVTC
jgi:hypothetical protein